MAKKKRTYIIPVSINWEMEVEADNAEAAIHEAWDRMGRIVSFGANAGRTAKVHGSKAKVKR